MLRQRDIANIVAVTQCVWSQSAVAASDTVDASSEQAVLPNLLA